MKPRLGNRAGNAMIEFALGSGILLLAFAGTFQFGYTFLQYNNLENAVARGARYASLYPYDSTTTTPSALFIGNVKNMVVYGSPSAGTSPALPGLTTGNVNLTVIFTNGVPSGMTVSISGYSINAVFSNSTLTNKPQITYAYQGVWTPV
ncbi:MAG TPA: TadE/TadG family type IV pilus assembly protein [Bryobacteraceae bacterium]|nr:TadE/TadG family type IV pilus assembly protein [Bryobacteraceae bacterium]